MIEKKTNKNTTQIRYKSSHTMRIRTTSHRNNKYSSHTILKSRSTTLTGYKFTAKFSEKKKHCSQDSNGNKNRLDDESFYQKNIERLLHLNPQDCMNELRRLNLTQNDAMNRKLVNFQVFPDVAHQAELEKHQGHIRLDRNFPFHGTHGRLTYDLHDKHWIPHIGINNPSNCKADTKNKGYQEIMFFDWKIQLEKVQLTRDLKDDKILCRGIRLPCKNNQGYCDPTTRTQLTIVWFPEETCAVFQVAKIHARMIKFHQKYFIESIPFEEVNPDQIRSKNTKFRNLHNIENKLTRFQIYPETELACKYKKPIYKTQYSEILVEDEHGFDLNTGHLIVDPISFTYRRKPFVFSVDTLSRRTYFWDTAVPCGSENSHNVVQLNPDEDKYYLLTPYPTLIPPLKKFSPESIRAIAHNPNIDLQSIGIYSKSDIQHHTRTQQFQELLTQMDTI